MTSGWKSVKKSCLTLWEDIKINKLIQVNIIWQKLVKQNEINVLNFSLEFVLLCDGGILFIAF